jgi:surfactin family lipopeptide synthetase A
MTEHSSLSDSKRKLLNAFLRRSLSQSVAPPIARRPAGEPIPLALSQEDVVVHADRLKDAPALYNESFTIHRSGPLDLGILEQSVIAILRRHEIWRTSYSFHDGTPEQIVQIVHPVPDACQIPFVDLRSLSGAAREEAAVRLASEDATKPFDLRAGPLVRLLVLQTDEQQFRLHFTIHQSIVDGLSVFRIFPTELAATYEGLAAPGSCALRELPVQFGDYAVWQRRSLSAELLGTQLAYWRKQLGGELPVLNWPTGRTRPTCESHRGVLHSFLLSEHLRDSLQNLVRGENATLFTILLAGFSALVHLDTDQHDIVFGTLSPAGRKHSEVQDLLGYFLNPVALRIRLAPGSSFRELLHQAMQVTSEAISNDDVTLQQISKELGMSSDPSRSPLFQHAISLAPDVAVLPPGWTQTYMDVSSGGARWDLYLEFSSRLNGIAGRAQYNPDLMDLNFIEKMVADLERILALACKHPESPLRALRQP